MMNRFERSSTTASIQCLNCRSYTVELDRHRGVEIFDYDDCVDVEFVRCLDRGAVDCALSR